jgi:hypothetical protein
MLIDTWAAASVYKPAMQSRLAAIIAASVARFIMCSFFLRN